MAERNPISGQLPFRGHLPISADAPIFDATLTPHRSLSERGFKLLMLFAGGIGLAVSIPFYLLGAWPVLGFMGLDILLIYIAFRYHYASARACERLVISRIAILFRAVSWRGAVREHHLNPVWTRIEREEHPEFGLERLILKEGKQRVELASMLGREERAEFAGALQAALYEVKR